VRPPTNQKQMKQYAIIAIDAGDSLMVFHTE
jgi:hypothetical protein